MSETSSESLATPAATTGPQPLPLVCRGCGCHLGNTVDGWLNLYREAVPAGAEHRLAALVPGAAHVHCSNCGRQRWYRPAKKPKVTP